MAWDAHQQSRQQSRRLKAPTQAYTSRYSAPPTLSWTLPQLDLNMEPTRITDPVAEVDSNLLDCPALTVAVSVTFTDQMVKSPYTRSYGSSPSFLASERHCNGLVRRIEHCCEELITRKDSAALGMHEEDDSETQKPLRFRITVRIDRRDTGLWAARGFSSYQKQPLTADTAREVILATHRMVGLFLRRHDRGFRWIDGAVREDFSERPLTARANLGEPLPLYCVPRSRFLESSQSWEFIPGFTIQLSFRSKNRFRRQSEFKSALRINSRQNSPLTLFHSEDLLWQALRSVDASFDSLKRVFDQAHESCTGLGGMSSCRHFDEDALHLELRIVNNLGPEYDHLHRAIHSKVALFRDPDGQDCRDFIRALERGLQRARDDADAKIDRMNDFDFRITELRSPRWTARDAARFRFPPTVSHSRRSVVALLDRIQTGISDVLRGHNIAVHISTHKRGHLVLEKVLVAHEKPGAPMELFATPEEEKATFVSRLRDRIQRDIDMVCRDTCVIDDIPDGEESHSRSMTTTKEQDTADSPVSPGRVTKIVEEFERRSSLDMNRLQDHAGPRAFPLVSAKSGFTSRVSSGSTLTSELLDGIPFISATNDPGNASPETPNLGSPEKEMPSVLEACPRVAESPTAETDRLDEIALGSLPDNKDTADGEEERAVSEAAKEEARISTEPPDLNAAPVNHRDASTSAMENHLRHEVEEPGSSDSNNVAPATPGEEEDVDSTPPSTPSLSSTGGSTPRNSLLITPNYLQGIHGTKEPVIRVSELPCEVEATVEIPDSPSIVTADGIRLRHSASLDRIANIDGAGTPRLLPAADVKKGDVEVETITPEPYTEKHLIHAEPSAETIGATHDRDPSAASTVQQPPSPSLLGRSSPALSSRTGSISSSLSDDELEPTSRGSVESISAPFSSPRDEPDHTVSSSRPPTAGYLGLGLQEARRVEVGLRGALAGRRFSLPPGQVLQLFGAREGDAARPGSSGSAKIGFGDRTERMGKRRRERRERPMSSGALLQHVGADDEEGEGDMLPKVMMIFAGMAVASKMLGKGSE